MNLSLSYNFLNLNVHDELEVKNKIVQKIMKLEFNNKVMNAMLNILV